MRLVELLVLVSLIGFSATRILKDLEQTAENQAKVYTFQPVEDARQKFKFAKFHRAQRQVNVFTTMWKSPISFSIDPKFPQETRAAILEAIGWFNSQTCVQFQQVSFPGFDSLQFVRHSHGCLSDVGKLGNKVNLQPETCSRAGVIAHEVFHALGFHHEHQRPDASRHVSIEYHNIQPGYHHDLHPIQTLETFGTPYDYGSVLHYATLLANYNYPEKKGMPTVVARQSLYQKTMGQRTELSFLDIYRLEQRYCGWQRCAKGQNQCANGGYPNPLKCAECKCPNGLAGAKCTDLAPNSFGCGGIATAGPHWLPLEWMPTIGGDSQQQCNWLITAPKGKQVELKFSDSFALPCRGNQNICENDYVELKLGEDWRSTGARLCCQNTTVTQLFKSDSNKALIIYKNVNSHSQTVFDLTYRIART